MLVVGKHCNSCNMLSLYSAIVGSCTMVIQRISAVDRTGVPCHRLNNEEPV